MSKKTDYKSINSKAFDRWIEEGWQWGTPITSEVFEKAKKGEWEVLLTPTKAVPRNWFGDLKGKKLLGLASGGGQQIPIFTAAGARCTVLDYSDKQLETEKQVAQREGYEVEIVKADMTKPLPFEDESFDIIFHPVSNDYIDEIEPLFGECYRILRKGGILLAGLGNGLNYVVDNDEERIINALPFNPLLNEDHKKQLLDDDAGYQFSHTVAEQIGSQLKAGFILTHIEDDTNGEGRLHELNIPTYMMTRVVKK